MKIGDKILYRSSSYEGCIGILVGRTKSGNFLAKFNEQQSFMHYAVGTHAYLVDGTQYEVDGTASYYFVSNDCELRVLGEV